MQESGVALNTLLTCAFISCQSPWYTYGGKTIRASQPASAAAFANITASEVVSAEIDATTGALLFTARAQFRKIAIFSSNARVAPSPSDPRVTMPVQPLS